MALTITKQQVKPDESLKVKPPQDRTRDENQKSLDSEVQTAAHTWRGMVTGDAKPETVPVDKRPVLRFAVDPDDKSELKRLIRRACTLHKCEPVWFEDAEDAKGRAVVTFTLGPRKPAKKKTPEKIGTTAAS